MQIAEHIHAIKVPFKIKASPTLTLERFVYAYIICGAKICLIDIGVKGYGKILIDYLATIQRSYKDISLIILTHAHPDHLGAAKSIKSMTGCKILAHELEKSWIEDIDLQFKQRPVPDFYSLVEGSVKVDYLVKDKDIIDLDNQISLEVLHTPGHSSGSLSILMPKDKALFSGDAILGSGQMPIFEDINESMNSLKKLKKLTDIENLLSAWADPKRGEGVHSLINDSLNYFQLIYNALNKIKNENLAKNSLKFTKLVLRKLKLPEFMANPLVVKAFSVK